MRRALALLGSLLILAAAPAYAQQIVNGGSGGVQAPVITCTPNTTVGTVCSVPTYSGATDQWTRNGTDIAAATASSYTTVSSDGGTTLSVKIIPTGVSISAASCPGGQLDFSCASNSALTAAVH